MEHLMTVHCFQQAVGIGLIPAILLSNAPQELHAAVLLVIVAHLQMGLFAIKYFQHQAMLFVQAGTVTVI
jgi:hypothetical protein